MHKRTVILVIAAICVIAPKLPAKDVDTHPNIWSNLDFAFYLKKFDERTLWDREGESETYRMTIDASIAFRETVIRLDRKSENSWLLTTKHKYRNRWRTWTRRLKSDDVRDVVARLNDARFWKLPANAEFVDPDEEEGKTRSVCLDGTYWILEAKVSGRYHGTGIHMCDEDAVFVPAGLAFIKLVNRDIGPVR